MLDCVIQNIWAHLFSQGKARVAELQQNLKTLNCTCFFIRQRFISFSHHCLLDWSKSQELAPEVGALWPLLILAAIQGGMEWAKRENWKILFALLHNLLTTGNLPRLIWSLKPGFIRPDIFHTSMDRNRKPLVLSPWLSTDNHKMIQSDLLWWFKEVDYKFHQFVQHILEAMSFTTAIKAYIKKGLISYSLTQLKENVFLIFSSSLNSCFPGSIQF